MTLAPSQALAANERYHGGSGDGFTLLTSGFMMLNGSSPDDRYHGGSGDGFTLQTSGFMTLNGSSPDDRYHGGTGDGFTLLTSGLMPLTGPAAAITLTANPKSITADGSSTSVVTANVTAQGGIPVADGTDVLFTSTVGSIGSTSVTKTTTDGIATATLTSSATDGVATVSATADNFTAQAATAVFFTRPGVTVTDYKEEKTGPGEHTVHAKAEANTTVTKFGDGTPTITVAKYSRNPAGPTPGGFQVAGDYIDVHLDTSDNVTQIEIKNYYTAAEIHGRAELSLRMRWWSGSGWVQCSDSGVNTNDVNGYSGYVWARITDNTTPTLADLSGAMFGAMGTASSSTPMPSATPTPSPTPTPTPAPGASPRLHTTPPDLKLKYLNINPQQAYANEPVAISTNVVNDGGTSGSYWVTLKINGQVEQTKAVSVGPDVAHPVTFTVYKSQLGTYDVDIGGQRGSFTIISVATTTPRAWGSAATIAILVLGVLVIGVAAGFVIRRLVY